MMSQSVRDVRHGAQNRSFDALMDRIDAMESQDLLPGGTIDGRFAVLLTRDGMMARLMRCSSIVRAEVIATAGIAAGWQVQAVYDLDLIDSRGRGPRYELAKVIVAVAFNTHPTETTR